MNKPTASHPLVQRHLTRKPTASHPLTNGISPVLANGISAVTPRVRCRQRLAFAGWFVFRFVAKQRDTELMKKASARRCHVTSVRRNLVTTSKDKNKTCCGVTAKSKDKSKTPQGLGALTWLSL